MFLRPKSMDFNYYYFLSFFHSERHITEQQESLESYKPGFPAQLYCLLAYNPGSIVSLSSLSFPVYDPFPIWNQSVVPCPVLTVVS